MKKNIGKHIIADFYKCDFDFLNQINIKFLKRQISLAIKECGLKEIGSFYKKFSKGSFSATISLAESHLTLHSWPEINYISLDIFVCNYKRNNTKNAYCLYKKMVTLFKPEKIKKKIISR